ncbi:ATP synthase j chain-domain-containing protein, partial [Suillus subaureus]
SSSSLQPYNQSSWHFSVFVLRPMAPFLAASAVTFYLVSKMQEMGVRSETYAKDPKNPYGAQIAKEAHH